MCIYVLLIEALLRYEMENRCIIFLFFFSYNDVSVVCFAFLYLTTLGLVNTFVMCSYHSLTRCKNKLLLTTSYLHEPLCVGNNVSVITLSVEYMEVEGSVALMHLGLYIDQIMKLKKIMRMLFIQTL